MRTHKFEIGWRTVGGSEPGTTVDIVHEPDQGWFKKHDRVRFALMPDGEFYWGDSYKVLHQDMMKFHREDVRPILIGAMGIYDGRFNDEWVMMIIQFFMTEVNSSDMDQAKSLFDKLSTWRWIEERNGPIHWFNGVSEL